MKRKGIPEVVVITGASAGVGRAIAERFAEDGAHIALIARGEERLAAAKRSVEERGGRALAISADVASMEEVERAAAFAERELGPIDIWVNDAMTTVFAPVSDMTADEYRRVTEVTYLGFVHGTLAALKRMRSRDRGVIVQVGSALAYRSIPLQSAYCAAKHAMLGFTTSLRTELLHDGSNVHVTMVHLPGMNTPQFDWLRNKLERRAQPVPPIYQPEIAAKAVHWAAHHRRREIYVGFPSVMSIVGNKIAPRLGDWYLARKGFKSQETGAPNDPATPGNLFEPVQGPFGAHGRFDKRAKRRSPELWLSLHRNAVAASAAAVVAAVIAGSSWKVLSSLL